MRQLKAAVGAVFDLADQQRRTLFAEQCRLRAARKGKQPSHVQLIHELELVPQVGHKRCSSSAHSAVGALQCCGVLLICVSSKGEREQG
jgi:hypothetical protein